MGLFDFDDKYAMFDITPVDNQFIAEDLPAAPGDYVKVWLYGLMQCYHPQAGMNLDAMAHELGLTQEEIMAAYRYWERRGLVKRISDHPPEFRYMNQRQRAALGSMAPDPAYETFAENLYGAFGNGRRLHGNEISLCYEWVEDLHLSPEVVIMLIKHMIHVKGKDFSIRSAQPMAALLAEEGATTMDLAEGVLSRERKAYEGAKKILRRFGKKRLPSEDEVALYRKWTVDWGFTEESIETACSETVKGDPNMGYLDGILSKLYQKNGNNPVRTATDVQNTFDKQKDLKELLGVLGNGSINDTTLAMYAEMEQLYPKEVILLAGRVCAGKGGHTDDVLKLLTAWQKRGLKTEKDILAYIDHFEAQNRFITELKELWGIRGRGNAADRTMLERWTTELKFSRESILYAATYATGKENPMAYLDTILKKYAEKGIRTPQEMDREHSRFTESTGAGKPAAQPAKTVYAQQFTQREFTGTDDYLDQILNREGTEDA